MRQWILMCALLSCTSFYAQYALKGQVVSADGAPIAKAHIDLSSLCTTTDDKGYFTISSISPKSYTLRIQKEGYHLYVSTFAISSDVEDTFMILSEAEELEEIIVVSQHQTTQNRTVVSQNEIHKNYSGSLASSLAQVAGLDAMTIGSQNAKPTMRGLGFNRLAVVENGVKQEGQQWGADHGLEIDALQTEQVEVIKGVGAIEYGSDAIAGVVKINNEGIPMMGTKGQALFSFHSNNLSLGNSWNISHRNNAHFFKFKASYVDYADFKVPTNEINYLNTRIPVYNGVMTNTAGNEINAFGQWGFIQNDFTGILTVSNFQSTSGFFAGAHGIPSVDKTLPDGNRRDINHPSQEALHTKVNYHAKWSLLHSVWDFKTAYQRNHRQEKSTFHSHYPNQSRPEKHPDVELDFLLNTWDTQLSYQTDWSVHHKTKVGISYQYQDNQSKGYSYLLPEYNRTNWAAFAKHQWHLQNEQLLDVGARVDYGTMNIQGFFDPVLFDYLNQKGYGFEVSSEYAQRSRSMNKEFLRGNFSLGYTFHTNESIHNSVTVGSHFRFPNAMELSANGIHHGAFRHEQGNPNLDVEKGWVIDWNTTVAKNRWKINTSAYAYYFDSYIFLKPSGTFSILPHGGQVYQYSQSKALLAGLEWDVTYQWKQWKFQSVVEYLYNQQLGTATHYPLPFSTPINGHLEIACGFKDTQITKDQEVNIQIKGAFSQNRIAQNEEITPGYSIVNVNYSSQLQFGKWNPYLQIGVQNIGNTKYYQHNSFYRAIDIPALGRSIYALIKIPF